MTPEQATQIVKQLEMIRKLKVAEMVEEDYSQSQLAQILRVSQPTISRMVPKISARKD